MAIRPSETADRRVDEGLYKQGSTKNPMRHQVHTNSSLLVYGILPDKPDTNLSCPIYRQTSSYQLIRQRRAAG